MGLVWHPLPHLKAREGRTQIRYSPSTMDKVIKYTCRDPLEGRRVAITKFKAFNAIPTVQMMIVSILLMFSAYAPLSSKMVTPCTKKIVRKSWKSEVKHYITSKCLYIKRWLVIKCYFSWNYFLSRYWCFIANSCGSSA